MSVQKSITRKPAASRQTAKPKSSTSTTPRKRKPAVKPAPVQPVEAAQVTEPKVLLKKRELIERVVERSGVKKIDARLVVEAFLSEFSEALAEGREMSVPPLGRVMINREKPIPNGRVFILKVRQKNLLDEAGLSETTAEKTAAE